MSLNIPDIRKRIEDIPKEMCRDVLKTQFLLGARISEVCGKSYGLRIASLSKKDYDGHPVALFMVQTAKKDGEPRYVALPLERKYDPWVAEIVEKYWPQDEDFVPLDMLELRTFPISIRNVQLFAEKAFAGLTYPIEKYTDKDKVQIPRHEKHPLTHALRHWRATNLIMDYGLDGIDVGMILGWSNSGMPNMAKRYVAMQWQRYFPKLLKEFN